MPYVFKEYPRVLHQSDGRTRTVLNDTEKADALAEGWSLVPVVDLTGNRFDSAVAEVAPAPEVVSDVPDVAEHVPDPKPKRGRKGAV